MTGSVLMVINALHSGGAEKTCIEVARDLNGRCDVEVVALLIGGPAEQELRDAGIKVTVMHAVGVRHQLASCWRLAALMRRKRPDTVITFLYLADLIGGGLARLLVPRARVFWNIRNNVLARHQVGAISFVASRINGALSRLIPNAIVYCSAVSRKQHESIGYRRSSGCVVENSADSVRFTFSESKRTAFRRGRFEDDFVFLFVGRFDLVKRVDIFVDASAQLERRFPGKARFVIAGRGMDAGNASLMATIRSVGFADRFELLGHVQDQQELYSATDCLVVTSESEGSPNSVYEAVATCLPAIILATTGTEHIVADGVRRLPTRDLQELVDAMGEVLAGGIPSPGSRMSLNGRESRLDHPLVTYYKAALPGG